MIKEILKNVYWRAIYGFRYVILYRKFGKVGLHTVIKRPLRIVRGVILKLATGVLLWTG